MHAQLAKQVREAVLSGTLPAGTRLPGSRRLALHLGVTRGVVADAYAALVADGTLAATVGSGTRVPGGAARPQAALQRAPAWFTPPAPAPVDGPPGQPGVHFQVGVATTATLDQRVWRKAWADAARQPVSGDYADPQGEADLRAALCAWTGRSRGLSTTAEHVLVTAGTLQALNLIVRALLPPGSAVLMENPGYRAARQVMLDAGHHVQPLSVDEDGAVVTAQTPPARLVYVTPSHQFPLGVRMSLPRRLALLEWAERHDALIVEDDYDGEFRYGAPPLPPLASLDRSGRVLYLGTLSKALTPAVRTGFLLAQGALMPALVRARLLLDGGHPLPVQRALTHLLIRGEVDRHVRRTRRWHAQVRGALTRELVGLAPLAHLGGIEAGLHLCLHLAPGLDAGALTDRLASRGIFVSTLASHTFAGPEAQALLLGYAGLTAAQARAGSQEIARMVRATPGCPAPYEQA
ncbi:GntR family transcriptional regulator [Deinococcus malanensis]|uniref:GntR family transcriptional regulator n=2 Tax=Deinococcus malanensis TaxID=1706855 RepID=A0ABQ2EVP5_9DEIO|nr:GntR family transcriptional regulator [Deinococcus malanensis]